MLRCCVKCFVVWMNIKIHYKFTKSLADTFNCCNFTHFSNAEPMALSVCDRVGKPGGLADARSSALQRFDGRPVLEGAQRSAGVSASSAP